MEPVAVALGGCVMRNNVAGLVLLLAVIVGVGGLGTDRGDRAARVTAACDTGPRHGLDGEQMGNAATVTAVGKDMGMPDRAVVVALATAMQESGLRNLDHGDRDSLGLFQQRPSQGWGTEQQVSDPRYAAEQFYAALSRVDGWERMRVTEAAQAVQISAYPEAYQQHVGMSKDVAEVLIPCAT